MVRKVTTYVCDKCSKRFRSFREAETCELDHITKDAVEDTLAAFAALTDGVSGGV